MSEHWTDALVALDACDEAVEWAHGYDSLEAAWADCQRGDWMLWLAGHCAGDQPYSDARRPLVLAACACARLALPHVPAGEDRPRVAIETAEAWARGDAGVTTTDVSAARADAGADAGAAGVARDAAWVAGAAAGVARVAAGVARDADIAECADLVREHYPHPPELPR
jgi:hypothetical protein